MTIGVRGFALAAFLLLSISSLTPPTSGQAPAAGPVKAWNQAVDQGVVYLKTLQHEDGNWGSGPAAPGVTGIVLKALLRTGKVAPTDPAAAKALKYIESLIDPKTGHLAGKGAKTGGLNYATSINVMALAEANRKGRYDAVIAKAADFLKKLQWDEGEQKTPADAIYGGAGYGGGSRPDLSNTHFFLDALVAAKTPAKDPAFKKAIIYVSRCQNLKGEHNDQAWAAKINDGSFIYGAGPTGVTRGASPEDGSRPGYGSMTYAGVKSLVVCGVDQKDLRVKKGLEWIGKHYTVDVNPGMPAGSGGRGLYYYLSTMAKSLEVLGLDAVTDGAGVKHDWRADITAALINRQRKNGSWTNDIDRWMEGNPDLCTAYALIALSHCKPKTK